MMISRALKFSFSVGTLLNLINSGAALLSGHLPPNAWKTPLKYLVPFLVSYYSSAAERRKRAARTAGREASGETKSS